MLTFNVGGKLFKITEEVCKKIPVLYNALSDSDDERYVNRSPILFEHVLSFIIDDNYKFPAEYHTELDFYDISYDKTKLYDPTSEINECLNKILKFTVTLTSRFEIIEDKIIELDNKIKRIDNISITTKSTVTRGLNGFQCINRCGTRVSTDCLIFCDYCSPIQKAKNECSKCLGTKENSNHKYCNICNRLMNFCNNFNCSNTKITGKDYCYLCK